MTEKKSAQYALSGLVPGNDLALKKTATPKARLFFAGMAIFFIAIVITGFAPSYQAMHNGTLLPHWVVHVHGGLMTAWLLIFFTQAVTAARGNLKFHRQLGIGAVVLGVLVWLSMLTVSVHATIAYHPPEQDFLFDLILMEFYAMASFGVFFTWGVLARKKDPAAHKRLLLLATLVLLQAAIDRIHWLPMFGFEYPYIFFMYLDFLLIPLFIYDFIIMRRIHRITWIGAVYIIVLQLSISAVWGSPAWHRYWFKITSPLMEKRNEVTLSDAQSEPLLGDYGDKNWHMSVIRLNGQLFIQLPDSSRFAMGATAETELFMKKMSVQISFIKAANGTVIKMINRQGASITEFAKMRKP